MEQQARAAAQQAWEEQQQGLRQQLQHAQAVVAEARAALSASSVQQALSSGMTHEALQEQMQLNDALLLPVLQFNQLAGAVNSAEQAVTCIMQQLQQPSPQQQWDMQQPGCRGGS